MNLTFAIFLIILIFSLFALGLSIKKDRFSIVLIATAFILLWWPCVAIQSKNSWIEIQDKEVIGQTDKEIIYHVKECWHLGCYFDDEIVRVKVK